METVLCSCKKCDAALGDFVNLWTQVGKSYFSPIVEPDYDIAVQSDGAVREGERGTLVEECQLQDIACAHCATILGLRCVATPVNHALDKNQILLRQASVELLTHKDEPVDFIVKRVLDVKEPSRVSSGGFAKTPHSAAFGSSSFPGVVDIFQLRAEVEGQREDINRIDSNGFKIVSVLEKRVVGVETEVGKLKDTLGGLRRDIGVSREDLTSLKSDLIEVKRAVQDQAPLAGLEKRLGSMTRTVGEARREISTLAIKFREEVSELRSEILRTRQDMEDLKSEVRASVIAPDHAEDTAALRAEMSQLRRQLDDARFKAAERVETPFPSRELDILTSNIAKISNRASQVETLQMEFEILKGRVERAEASRKTPDDRWPTQATDQEDRESYYGALPPQRKRASAGMGPAVDDNSTTKRPAYPPGFSDPPIQAYDASSDWPPTSSKPAGREDRQKKPASPQVSTKYTQ
ncbi:hypothetical protein B0T26DRAFT_669994 [Lasiosphaeria miniovina]|uniref:Yippee/Mis18/Cereblon domain-containing protein n=1 Tax=Lasiosphaeria miniovina TaxID=1954250 RepID=A0AA40EDM5_9PEZI|nr:uncharacterized protein B0T26DRAFT_669994 [Lasiosphaeria miniovina]KAK0733596.1 hypothetical protein B0T26DRAFT_669994 [Lasiosphaeria miniovina]